MGFLEKHLNQTTVDFINLLFKLALPIIFQNFLNSSMALMDTLMIGQLNETAIAAVGIANQFVFIFIIVQFGIHSGVSIFTAQYWGKKDLANIKRLVGIGLMAGLAVCSFFTFVALLTPGTPMALFSTDTEVVRLGSGYLRIVGISFVISVVTYSYTNNLRSMGIVKLPMYASMIAVALNIVLNYILIFGKLGAPALGVNGAAIATCISRFTEGFILMGIVYYKRYPVAARISEMVDFDYPFLKRIYNTCWPVFLNELVWVTGISLYNLVYARIGNTIGSGRNDEAYLYGKYLLTLQFTMAIFAAFFLELPVYWVMALVATEQIYQLCLGIPRFLSRKWIKNLVRN